MARGAALENRQLLEWPWFGHDLPVGMLADGQRGSVEIRLVIGAKVKPRALPCPLGGGAKKFRLHDAVFMMAPFWPGIGEQDIDSRERRSNREGIEKITGIGVDKVKITQFGAVALAISALNPVLADVDADAEFGRMGGSVGREKMAVSASNFPYERS